MQLALDTVTGEEVAIKLMERGSKITKYVERELINHSHLLHPHIIQVCFESVQMVRDIYQRHIISKTIIENGKGQSVRQCGSGRHSADTEMFFSKLCSDTTEAGQAFSCSQ